MIYINEKLRLIPFDGNYEVAIKWYQDKNILWYSEHTEEAYTLETIKKMYDYLNEVGDLYIIEYLENEWSAIGDATFSKETLPIVIDPKFWGRGIGSLVIQCFIKHGRSLGWERLRLSGIYDYNKRSLAMFTKLGFEEIERIEDKVVMELKL